MRWAPPTGLPAALCLSTAIYLSAALLLAACDGGDLSSVPGGADAAGTPSDQNRSDAAVHWCTRGDDPDGDGISGDCDNCPHVANADQLDRDGDGIGDECEDPFPVLEDGDGDGIPDVDDNCWDRANPDQADRDGDLWGDECDNCPDIANNDQADVDGDGAGDACSGQDVDQDGDGRPDDIDNCPWVPNADQVDMDADGAGNECDNCPMQANADQTDSDDDGVGDLCQGEGAMGDADGDGHPNAMDNCPLVPNAGQADADRDGVGNRCDNCRDVRNPFQEDADGDGIGNHCDTDYTLPDDAPACADGSTEGMRLPPNIYLLLDISGSMTWEPGTSDTAPTLAEARWGVVTAALDGIAPDLALSFNLGVGSFPARCSDRGSRGTCNDTPGICTATALPDELLPMSDANTAAALRGSYAGVRPFGSTPTSTALDQVRVRELYKLPDDPFEAVRKSAVVLITDGAPNSPNQSCNSTSSLPQTETAAAALRDAGVPVYVIGIAGTNEGAMQDIAVAGGSDNPNDPDRDWFPAANAGELTAALETIADATAGCTVVLQETGGEPPDYGLAAVSMTASGTTTDLPRADWSIITGSPTILDVTGSSCTAIQDAAATGTVTVNVRVGCQAACAPSEICGNLIDDDCNGMIDDTCEGSTCICIAEFEDCGGNCPSGCVAAAEICDGLDNDCDGVTDEGCCAATDEICDDHIDNDCDGQTDEGCGCGPEVCDSADNDCDGVVDEGCFEGPF